MQDGLKRFDQATSGNQPSSSGMQGSPQMLLFILHPEELQLHAGDGPAGHVRFASKQSQAFVPSKKAHQQASATGKVSE